MPAFRGAKAHAASIALKAAADAKSQESDEVDPDDDAPLDLRRSSQRFTSAKYNKNGKNNTPINSPGSKTALEQSPNTSNKNGSGTNSAKNTPDKSKNKHANKNN